MAEGEKSKYVQIFLIMYSYFDMYVRKSTLGTLEFGHTGFISLSFMSVANGEYEGERRTKRTSERTRTRPCGPGQLSSRSKSSVFGLLHHNPDHVEY